MPVCGISSAHVTAGAAGRSQDHEDRHGGDPECQQGATEPWVSSCKRANMRSLGFRWVLHPDTCHFRSDSGNKLGLLRPFLLAGTAVRCEEGHVQAEGRETEPGVV